MTENILTNTEPSGGEKVGIKNIAKVAAELDKDVVSRFKGVPVIVDERLLGNNYYIAVSQYLYDQIDRESGYK